MLDRLAPPAGARRKKKRVGRGSSSGRGKTCGRGTKGDKARTGFSLKPGFEGGQMPLVRRVPKRGFTNIFRVPADLVKIADLEKHFADGAEVTVDALKALGLVRLRAPRVKVLADGLLTKRLILADVPVSRAAREKILAAGGRVQEAATPTGDA